MRLVFLFAVMASTAFGTAAAQNGAGVFGPRVIPGHRLAEHRYTLAEPGDDLSSPWIQRLHYEAAAGDRLMWRLIGQIRDPGGGTELDSAKGELFVDLGTIRPRWHTGIRLDAFLRNGDRPEELGFHWTNEFTLNDHSFIRVIALTSYQLGENAADRPQLSTRASYVRLLGGGWSAGMESYDQWGPFDELARFDRRVHELGPYVMVPVTGGWSVYLGGLWGLSEAAPNTSLRWRLTYTY
ncbi:MAG: hypothetical protein AAGI89_13365 [Pseudomonadota bacterium]